MNPMDFEVFLWAKYDDGIKSVIKDVNQDAMEGNAINEVLHETFNNDIREYIIVGGMPKVLSLYVNNKDFGEVFLKQTEIVDLYKRDIQQYQTNQDNKIKTLKTFDSIPQQFSKENHRFFYSIVEKNRNARYFGNALQWLERTVNIKICYHIEYLKGSLVDAKGTLFKVYMNDIGLLVCMLGEQYVYRIQNNQLGIFKGALYEQLLAQMLIAKNEELYYIRIGDYEIDFLFEYKGAIIPIECKSGGSTKSKSLKSNVDLFVPFEAFKVSTNNINTSNDIIKAIPHYVFALLSIFEIADL